MHSAKEKTQQTTASTQVGSRLLACVHAAMHPEYYMFWDLAVAYRLECVLAAGLYCVSSMACALLSLVPGYAMVTLPRASEWAGLCLLCTGM